MRRTALPALLAALLGGCQLPPCAAARAGDRLTCPAPGWLDRGFSVWVPASWDGAAPLPLLYVLHGGGGNRAAASRVTCPGGDQGDPACLPALAVAAGYAVVLPDGTGGRPLRNVRTWNAGGGGGGWQCVSGAACNAGVDDMAYLDAVHAEVGRVIPVDARRVYATGLSNGGALAHRLACERGARFAAIAPVGSGNQWAAAGGACPGAGVAVLAVNGTADPCWTYETSARSCIDANRGAKVGVAETLEGWRLRNGCAAAATTEAIPDADPGDGTTATRQRWSGCAAAVELIRVDGGGHTWPGGYAYLGSDTVGPVARDFALSPLLLDFFAAHVRP